jgi:phosphoesterase RecJ-like protein
MNPTATESREQTIAVLSAGERFLLVTHEHPDGDALGSLLSMSLILRSLGKDVVSFIAADDLPLSYEYDWLDVSEVVSEIPEDADQRVVVFLDADDAESR